MKGNGTLGATGENRVWVLGVCLKSSQQPLPVDWTVCERVEGDYQVFGPGSR